MTKFDTEDVLDFIKNTMTDAGALNAKITAIENEKTSAGKPLHPQLSSIADKAYYEQTWSDKILQSSPAIFYGIADVQAVDGGGVTAKTYRCFVNIVYINSGQQNDGPRRVNRYSRAIEELFERQYASELVSGKIKIESVQPMAFQLEMGTSEEVVMGGIQISLTIV